MWLVDEVDVSTHTPSTAPPWQCTTPLTVICVSALASGESATDATSVSVAAKAHNRARRSMRTPPTPRTRKQGRPALLIRTIRASPADGKEAYKNGTNEQ